MAIDARHTGLVLGLFFGGVHALWALMVAVGLAQPFLTFIFQLHFIVPPYQVAAFSLGRAAGLVLVTGLIGGFFGWAFGLVWNMMMKKK